jgi:ABC-type transport system involved in cytochrome c biogenesis permease component
MKQAVRDQAVFVLNMVFFQCVIFLLSLSFHLSTPILLDLSPNLMDEPINFLKILLNVVTLEFTASEYEFWGAAIQSTTG